MAQTTSAIRGTVVDQTGATISDARVSLRNNLTGFDQSARTQQDGTFHLSNIPLRSYEIAVEANGFNR